MDKHFQSAVSSTSFWRMNNLAIVAACVFIAFLLLQIINSEDSNNLVPEVTSIAEEAVQNVNEVMSPTENPAEIQASNEPSWQSFTIKSGDTLVTLLAETHANTDDIAEVLSLSLVKESIKKLAIGSTLSVQTSADDHLLALTYTLSQDKTLSVHKTNEGFNATVEEKPLISKQKIVKATIRNSLFDAGRRAGVPRKIMTQLSDIFSDEVNFSKDLHPGDQFSLVYEDKYVGNRLMTAGQIKAAQITTKNKTYTALAYTDSKGRVSYYSPEGHGLKAGFTRSPLHYTRISSPFNLGRVHPILHIKRPHLGVDLAAPRGTPVKATSDGIITFVGKEGGYGNLVQIDHGHGISTRYAHLARFSKGLKRGMHISQGDVIAYVGNTGLATGPHLHYEFRVNNAPRNPLTVSLPSNNDLPTKYKKSFLEQTQPLLAQLDSQHHYA